MISMRAACCVLVLAACRFNFDPIDEDESSVFRAVSLPNGGGAEEIEIAQSDPNVLYAIVDGRLHRSGDRGARWSECSRTANVLCLAIDPLEASTVFVGNDQGVRISYDDCATWTSLGTDSTTTLALAGTDIYAGSAGIRRWREGSWSALPSPADGFYITSIAVSANTILAATDAAGIVRSTDGTAFVASNTGLPSLIVKKLIFPQPTNPSIVLAQTYAGVARSLDGGATWTTDATAADGRDALTVDPADATYVLSGTWKSIERSTDGGATFDNTDLRTANMEWSYPHDLAIDSSGRTYAATSRSLFAAHDRLLAWTDISVGINAWSIRDLVRDETTNAIYAATHTGVLRSTDGGATWSVESAGMEISNSILTAIHVVPQSPNVVIATGAGWLWLSMDYGATYVARVTASASDLYVSMVVRSEWPSVWFGTGTRLWRSDDGASTWTQHSIAGDVWVNDLLLAGGGEIWVATEAGVYRSIDDGASFQLKRAGRALSLDRSNGSVLVGMFDGVWADGGMWVGLNTYVHDLVTTDVAWFAAAEDGVFFTTDAGAIWRELRGLATERPRRLLVDGARLLVGTDGFGLYETPLPY